MVRCWWLASCRCHGGRELAGSGGAVCVSAVVGMVDAWVRPSLGVGTRRQGGIKHVTDREGDPQHKGEALN